MSNGCVGGRKQLYAKVRFRVGGAVHLTTDCDRLLNSMQTLPLSVLPDMDLRNALESAVSARRCRAAFVISGTRLRSPPAVVIARKSDRAFP